MHRAPENKQKAFKNDNQAQTVSNNQNSLWKITISKANLMNDTMKHLSNKHAFIHYNSRQWWFFIFFGRQLWDTWKKWLWTVLSKNMETFIFCLTKQLVMCTKSLKRSLVESSFMAKQWHYFTISISIFFKAQRLQKMLPCSLLNVYWSLMIQHSLTFKDMLLKNKIATILFILLKHFTHISAWTLRRKHHSNFVKSLKHHYWDMQWRLNWLYANTSSSWKSIFHSV